MSRPIAFRAIRGLLTGAVVTWLAGCHSVGPTTIRATASTTARLSATPGSGRHCSTSCGCAMPTRQSLSTSARSSPVTPWKPWRAPAASCPAAGAVQGDSASFGAQGIFTDRPTITYTPLTGNRFIENIGTPISPQAIFETMSTVSRRTQCCNWGWPDQRPAQCRQRPRWRPSGGAHVFSKSRSYFVTRSAGGCRHTHSGRCSRRTRCGHDVAQSARDGRRSSRRDGGYTSFSGSSGGLTEFELVGGEFSVHPRSRGPRSLAPAGVAGYVAVRRRSRTGRRRRPSHARSRGPCRGYPAGWISRNEHGRQAGGCFRRRSVPR